MVALASRRVVHVGVTRHPTDAWVARQRRESTPFGERPTPLIRDNDSKYGRAFAQVSEVTGVEELRTAYRAPRQNALYERFLGSVRREWVTYYNGARPHEGLQQRVPDGAARLPPRPEIGGRARALPVVGGLHHTHQRAA